MKSRSLAIALTLCLLGTMLVAAAPATAVGDRSPRSADAPSSLLFVQQTEGGKLERAQPGVYRLVLRGVSPTVATFTDRPRRQAGEQDLIRFVHGWAGNGFAADAPNAALVLRGAPSSRDVAMLTLSHPRYDRRAQRLTYTAKPLHGGGAASLAGFSRRGDPLQPLSFKDASLFIDDSENTTFVPISLAITTNEPGQMGMLQIDSDTGVHWSLGRPGGRSGMFLSSPSGPLPVASLSLSPTTLSFRTTSEGPATLQLNLFLECENGATVLSGAASIGEGISVTADVNGIGFTIASGAIALPLE